MNYGPFDTLMFCVLAQNNLSGLNEFLENTRRQKGLDVLMAASKMKPGFIHFRRHCGTRNLNCESIERILSVHLAA